MTGAEQNIWAEPGTAGKTGSEESGVPMTVLDGAGKQEPKPEKETEETKRMKERFGFFGPAAFLYAVFYTFCMYKNGSGVTFPFFVAGSLLFLCLSLAKLETTLKKGSVYYMAAIVLLGISTFCTDDGRIIFLNKLGIFLLMMSLLLKQYFDTSKWGPGKFLSSIFRLIFGVGGVAAEPFRDGAECWANYRREKGGKADGRIWAVGLGLLAGIPLLLVVLLLLSSADALFRQMAERLLGGIRLDNVMNIAARILLMFLAAYCLTAFLCKKKIDEEVKDRRSGEPVLAITVTGMLTALYLVFSVVQINGLFLGRMQLPEGYTYAAYAREGFFQLLTVSLLNLVIVLVCLCYFKSSKVLKTVLIIMSVCTYIMIASSAMRMVMYVRSYYLTFLRVLVFWGLALLAVLFAGVMIHIFREKFHLFRYCVAVVTVMYLALSFAHPDYLIARINLANVSGNDGGNIFRNENGGIAENVNNSDTDNANNNDYVNVNSKNVGMKKEAETGTGYQDYWYLSGLCADAAPVLVPCMESMGYDMKAWTADETPVEYGERVNSGKTVGYPANAFGYVWMEKMERRAEDLNWRTFNLSRYWMIRLFGRAAGK